MEKKTATIGSAGLLLPALLCEMLSMCTSEERRDLYRGLSRVSDRGALGAVFNALFKGSEPEEDKRWASQITAALSIPACVVVKKLLAARE
ncbi:MAG: hypothetical protein K2F93_05780 [Muribaculaceae bacterium]|nr:hypothetical protein [Muribaculaceae bacterium]MDE6057505.1 hypothetical protein [Muribaculaceae bacterium]MDE6194591.1 hypothetical protein [Muribaculaceae bacterium]MDE6855562.1 hypothetical protein [Muribaculaceae bacterium]